MNIAFIVIASIIFLLTLNLMFNISLNYDVFNNNGEIKIKLFKVPIFIAKLVITGDMLKITDTKKKRKEINIDFNEQSLQMVNEYAQIILKYIHITNIDTFFNICLQNPFLVSIICGNLNIFLGFVYSKISTIKKEITLKKSINVGFRHDIITLKATTNFVVTIYDCVYALYKVFKIGKRKQFENEKKQNCYK